MAQRNSIQPLSHWNNSSITAWANGTNTNNNANKATTTNRQVNWKDHTSSDLNGSYLLSPESDWVLTTARRSTIHYGCTNCYGLNFTRRVGITNNGDGTFTTHFHFCSEACKNFNKRQSYFAYQFYRGGNTAGGGDNLFGPRQDQQVTDFKFKVNLISIYSQLQLGGTFSIHWQLLILLTSFHLIS